MADPTSTNLYEINQLPDDPSQFEVGTFSDGGYTWTYQKIGKFYFGFWGMNGGGSALMIGLGDLGQDLTGIFDTLDHFASLIGVTVNTYYPTSLDINFLPVPGALHSNVSGSPGYYFWDGANYVSGNGNRNYVAIGFLAN